MLSIGNLWAPSPQHTQAHAIKAYKQRNTRKLTVTATAYTANCIGCTGITATGFDLHTHPDAKVIAVDPAVIPLGSRVKVPGYGEAIASDTGGAIDGAHIDLYMRSYDDAITWGRREVTVEILSEGKSDK